MIGPFFIGDVPTQPVAIDVYRDAEEGDLSVFADVEVVLTDAYGEVVPGLTAVIEGSMVVVIWPETTPFETGGIYELSLTLVGLDAREALAPITFVVQGQDGWHTLASARREWTTGAPADDVLLYQFLESAKAACIAYAPAIPVDVRIPIPFRQAQLMQARNLFNALKTTPGESQDGELFIIRPYPLDNFVKTLLRPKRAVGLVG